MTVSTRVGIAASVVLITPLIWLGGCAGTPPAEESAGPAKPVAAVNKPVSKSEPPLLMDALRGDYPATYTVQPGDTVWDLSAKFLNEPWRWKGLWGEQGDSAPALYAGNVLQVADRDGHAEMQVLPGKGGTIKLSPKVRVELITQPIPTLPAAAIQPFIDNAIVMSREEWEGAPYVIGNVQGQPLPSAGARVFARGGIFDLSRYRMFRPTQRYTDPESGDSLGYSMTYVGEAQVEDDGDPAVLTVVSGERGVRPGDRLLPPDTRPPTLSFDPKSVPIDTRGTIIGTLDNALLMGRYSNVAIDLGAYAGMEPGHVLGVRREAETIVDPVTGERVKPSDSRAGIIMLYKVFDLVSYGLVVESLRDVRVNDQVGEP